MSGNLKLPEIKNHLSGKGDPKIPEEPFNGFVKILNAGSISFKKHAMGFFENLDYDINIPQNMKAICIEYGINISKTT